MDNFRSKSHFYCNHFDLVATNSLKQYCVLMAAESIGDVTLSCCMINMKISKDFVKDLKKFVWIHSVASCSKCLTNLIGKKYIERKFSY